MRAPEETDEVTASAAARTLGRRRNVLLAQHHREQGWSIAQIAHLLDRAPATVRGYLHDPTGTKAKARKNSYAGSCERCGALTSGADGKGRASRHCQRCKPQSRARWTRETVRGAHRFWHERFGFIASSADWSGSHARRRGGEALERYQSARWPSQSVIRRLYGTPAAARADAFAEPPSSVHVPPPPRSSTPRPQPPPRDDSGEGPVRARDDASVHGGRRAHAPSPRTATRATAAAGAIPTQRA